MSILIYVIIFSFVSLKTFAQLQVFPTRVFLNQRQTSGHLTLKNTTESAQKYKIELKFFSMNKNGQFLESKNNLVSPLSLAKNIKFSPSEVSLDPGAQQTVRLMLVNSEKLNLSEYYIHIYFVPDQKKDEVSQKKQFQLQGKVAVAIPILFRNGVLTYDPELKDISLKLNDQGDLIFNSKIKSKNNTFFYGDIEAKVQKPENSKSDTLISYIKGVSSYVPEREFLWKMKSENFETKDLKLKKGMEIVLTLKNDVDDSIEFKKEINLKIQ